MRFFHQTHFGLWSRPALLARSDAWFVDALTNATAYASFQGYQGARWPKEVGVASAARSNPGHGFFDAPSVGAMSPNATFPLLYWNTPSFQNLLIWQQPHPIWMTEVERLNSPNATAAAAVERRMGAVVEATADFMASFASQPPAGSACLPGCKNELWLGPPLERQSEGSLVVNPVFELTYWRTGLFIASAWRNRAGLPVKPQWADVLQRLAHPKTTTTTAASSTGTVLTTVYDCPSGSTALNAIGWLNGASISAGGLNETIMNATLLQALYREKWDTEWGTEFQVGQDLYLFMCSRCTTVQYRTLCVPTLKGSRVFAWLMQIGFPLNLMRLGWRSERAVDILLINEPANF